MIWATVSSRSCFCWLYRASPSLAARNIINLISVLTIWWCPCVESSLVLLEEGVCYDQCIFLANSMSLCPASFRISRPNLPVTAGVSWLPTFAFQSPIMKRTSFLSVRSKRPCWVAGNALGKCLFVVDNTPVCLVEMLGFGSGDFHHSRPGLIISSTFHAHITDKSLITFLYFPKCLQE